MNFVPGEVHGDTLKLPFAEAPVPEGLRARLEGRELVIVGLRPEHVEDANVLDDAKRDGGVTFDADVDVVEWLGAELYAYIPFDTHADVAQKLEELDRDLDGEGMRTQVIVALGSESRVRDGSTASLWFDPARLLVFDPETGENLTYDEDAARRVDAETEEDRKAALERAHRDADTADSSGRHRRAG